MPAGHCWPGLPQDEQVKRKRPVLHVTEVKPHRLFPWQVGSAVDLPQISVIVMGLDEWPTGQMLEIREDRLLRVVRQVLGSQIRQLKAAPAHTSHLGSDHLEQRRRAAIR